ncbi:ABC transporter permease [Piscirickettsia litoralis]|uniref:Transport permease protein n=1 Tax=Piscirickettsia litoralis TaxID=1891921 RepID=A0ABX3A4N2_9GAMM|nr:ABC transporter permease [Piscirickettsia litoralis]ODN43826.1 ABC transporter permease [Piscirickettsia litoralis]
MELQWIALKGLIYRELERCFRIWPQTLLPPIINITLYFIIFGTILGDKIGQVEGYSYIQYIIPGLVMMSMLLNSYNNVVSSLFGARFQGFIEEMLVSPMKPSMILLGYITGGVMRGVVVGFLVLIVALFFTSIKIHHIGLTIIVAVLATVLFSAAGFINAVFARKFDDVTIIPTFVIMPLTYLGGVFYSVSHLPESLRWLCYMDPIYYVINVFRYAILDIQEVNFWLNMSILSLFAAFVYKFFLLLAIKREGSSTIVL